MPELVSSWKGFHLVTIILTMVAFVKWVLLWSQLFQQWWLSSSEWSLCALFRFLLYHWALHYAHGVLPPSCTTPELSLYLRCACILPLISLHNHKGQETLNDSVGVQSGRILGDVGIWGGLFRAVLKVMVKESVYREMCTKGEPWQPDIGGLKQTREMGWEKDRNGLPEVELKGMSCCLNVEHRRQQWVF